MSNAVPTVLRLVTGEDIIADTVIKSDAGTTTYSVSDPLKIVYLPATKDTHISLSLMQWMFVRISDNQTFDLHERNVLFTTEPSDSLLEYYYKTVAYFIEVRESQKEKIRMEENKIKDELYEEFAMSDDEELSDLMDSDEMKNLMDYLNSLSKKDRGTLH